ncbi:hypothetical protein EDB86DRAFT_2878947 [Lactarius hatsudake]|nr:hypothetical protein EDB86DRAFT_2878947 [Lactarius hatsudake]
MTCRPPLRCASLLSMAALGSLPYLLLTARCAARVHCMIYMITCAARRCLALHVAQRSGFSSFLRPMLAYTRVDRCWRL